jgi:DNA-binding transcriptional ArsR family regulator
MQDEAMELSGKLRGGISGTRNGRGDTAAGDADVASSAALIGDRTRARFLLALADGRSRPAHELAALAGVSRPTASSHLAKLVEAGLVGFERAGRYCYYHLTGREVARAIEALEVIAPREPVRSLRQANVAESLQVARIEYDHLAGRLAVALAQALKNDGSLVEADGVYQTTEYGEQRLRDLGVLPRRPYDELPRSSPACFDWSERLHHIGGELGRAITQRLIDLGWLSHHRRCRATLVTAAGVSGLRETFGVDLENPSGLLIPLDDERAV